jgi:prepilin-type N-terminal cleavage/methylation domain-containing protein
MLSSFNKRGNAFTLIELLVVISIIAILMAIMMPALRKVREQGKTVVCASHLRGLGQGFVLYALDNDGYISPINAINGKAINRQNFPGMTNSKAGESFDYRRLILPLLMDIDVNSAADAYWKMGEIAFEKYGCPTTLGKRTTTLDGSQGGSHAFWVTYGQNANTAGWKEITLKKPSSTVLLTDVAPNSNGVVGYAIGIQSEIAWNTETPDRIGRWHGKKTLDDERARELHPEGIMPMQCDKQFNTYKHDGSVSLLSDEYEQLWRRDGQIISRLQD